MHKKQVTLKNALRAVFASLALLTACPVLAATDGIMVKDAWVRAAPPSATVQAGFFTLINHNNGCRGRVWSQRITPVIEKRWRYGHGAAATDHSAGRLSAAV